MLIAAAFVGPGTVTTCIRAGVDWRYGLLWALLLSVFATWVLQEMAGRLGLTTGDGIPGVIRQSLPNRWLKAAMLGVILSAIVVGNAAYEAGNISGAVLGLQGLTGHDGQGLYPWLSGLLAFGLLWYGNSRLLERVFTILVLLMSLSFLVTAILTRPDLTELLSGLFLPRADSGNLLTVVALIGTTVVPYNLFLYTSLVSEKWKSTREMGTMRRDILLSVAAGGLVSMAIVVTAAGSGAPGVQTLEDLSRGLEPLYGATARFGLGIGLFAAGITSAITAPLAAAYVARQCFGWPEGRKQARFRAVWIFVLLSGILALSWDFRPLEVIFFAQVANGILLPVIAIFLWWAVNRVVLMGDLRNNLLQNAAALAILVLVTGLGIWSILKIILF
ncbi:Nramp family divalent metal transporter [Robiginitalea marina]|uniref:Nramp family divalent metal transporter n=1 Tax=Robiginitalea marina TaxID=2954105 RepID=A0ABT1AUZ2_9FLAO|nr:Nramp family divalent metal transporter [Robiginitalea marina]MCO5723435.1 Nramp family divalent metal transporter [Robiginitalea marina]